MAELAVILMRLFAVAIGEKEGSIDILSDSAAPLPSPFEVAISQVIAKRERVTQSLDKNFNEPMLTNLHFVEHRMHTGPNLRDLCSCSVGKADGTCLGEKDRERQVKPKLAPLVPCFPSVGHSEFVRADASGKPIIHVDKIRTEQCEGKQNNGDPFVVIGERIKVISLDRRPERQTFMKAMFKSIGVPNGKIQFFKAIDCHRWGTVPFNARLKRIFGQESSDLVPFNNTNPTHNCCMHRLKDHKHKCDVKGG